MPEQLHLDIAAPRSRRRWRDGAVYRTAILSADGIYRWQLGRRWGDRPLCAFAMLNPSIANADIDDPTIVRCMDFAWDWGYGGIIAVNAYGLRSTDPRALRSHPDPVGPENDDHLNRVAEDVRLIVLAWGGKARQDRAEAATEILHRCYTHGGQLATLGWTKTPWGPRHPLYVRGDTRPTPWYGEELKEATA